MATTINGMVLSRDNIQFLKSVQENDRRKRAEEVDVKIAKIKNFNKTEFVTNAVKPVKKLSHTQRKARKASKDKEFGNRIKDNSGFHASNRK